MSCFVKNWRYAAILLALGCTYSAPVLANEDQALFMKATQAYEKGDFAAAEESFGKLLSAGNDSPVVWYDLGNSYYRLGKNGSALWAFKEAERRQPRWEDLKANIVLVEQKAVDELPPLHPSWQQTLFFWHFIFSAIERAVLFVIFNLLFWSLLVANKIRRHEMTSVAIALSLVLTLATGSSLAKELFFTQPEGVVKVPAAKVHSAGSVNAQELFEIHECTQFFIEEEQNGWLLINLSDGKRGWVSADDVAYSKSLK